MKQILRVILLCMVILNITVAQELMLLEKQEIKQEEGFFSKAVDFYKTGKYKLSVEILLKSLSIKEKVLGKKHLNTAIGYNRLGALYESKGDYTNALNSLQKSLSIFEEVLGKEDINTAKVYNNISLLYKNMGNYQKALSYLQKSLSIFEEVLGKEDINTAIGYNNLGEVYENMGNYLQALKYHRKSLAIKEKVLGDKHISTAISYNNIGRVHENMGDYPVTLNYYKKYIAINEKVHGKEHANTAIGYNNIGLLYQKMGDYPKALHFYKQALAIGKKVYGKAHINTEEIYNNMGTLYQKMGNYHKALNYLQKSLLISKKVLGNEHVSTARGYNNLGNLYQKIGNYPKALSYYQKDLTIKEKVLGKEHPDTAISYKDIGLLYENIGDYKKAYTFGKKSFNNFILNRDKNFLMLNSSQKKLYLKSNKEIAPLLLETAYLYSQEKNSPKDLLQITLVDWLNYKGSSSENSNLLRAIQDTSTDTNIKEKIDKYFDLQKRIGFLYSSLGNNTEAAVKSAKKIIEGLENERNTIEQFLSQSVEKYKDFQKLKTIDYKQIASILTDDELYIDYAATEKNYYVFTLDNNGTVSFNKLEQTRDVNKVIETFRKNIDSIKPKNYPVHNTKEDNRYKDKIKQILHEIYKLVIEPIKDKLASKNKLIISQDGKLNLIPLEILYNNKDISKGKYLVHSKTIRYTPSGKSLLQLHIINKDKKTSNKQVELFYNPSFGMEMDDKKLAFVETMNIRGSRGKNGKWAKLDATEKEGKAIKNLYKKSFNVSKHHKLKANIENLLKIKQPTILHIATHGYFLDDPEIINPLLKSGIVLAGANKNPAYGQVSALKLSGLDLKGTQLVVLSACETGVGESQGLSGLNKVFIQAGAKSVISSLWKVPDQETKDLMVSMHKSIKDGNSSYIALQKAKEKFINDDVHPYFWGAFIYSGL